MILLKKIIIRKEEKLDVPILNNSNKSTCGYNTTSFYPEIGKIKIKKLTHTCTCPTYK